MRVKQLADIKNVFSRISSEWPSVTWRCTDSYVSDLSPCEIPDGFHSQAKSSTRRTCSLLPCIIPLLPSIHFRKHFLPERRHDRHFQPSLQHGHHHLRSARRFFFHRRELASSISRYGFDRIVALPPVHIPCYLVPMCSNVFQWCLFVFIIVLFVFYFCELVIIVHYCSICVPFVLMSDYCSPLCSHCVPIVFQSCFFDSLWG